MDQETRIQWRAYSKEYYERLKMSPQKKAARNAKVAEAMKAYRARKKAQSAKPEITKTEITPPETEITPEITLKTEITAEITPESQAYSPEDLKQLLGERAAIKEFDGGLSRDGAEQLSPEERKVIARLAGVSQDLLAGR